MLVGELAALEVQLGVLFVVLSQTGAVLFDPQVLSVVRSGLDLQVNYAVGGVEGDVSDQVGVLPLDLLWAEALGKVLLLALQLRPQSLSEGNARLQHFPLHFLQVSCLGEVLTREQVLFS